MNPTTRKLATLMGSASIFTLANAISAQAQQSPQTQIAQAQTAQAAEVPEQVLVTGSLIHGAAAVGVPVTNLGAQDFTETGNVTIGDLFRITGRIGQSKYTVEGQTYYSVDLIADSFAVLAKAKVKTVEDDMQE